MKLVHPDIDTHFEFTENGFPSLVIENQDFFYRTVSELKRQTNGGEGRFVLSSSGTPLPVSGNIDLLIDFFPFDINRKTLLNKIVADLEKLALSDKFFEQSRNILGQVEQWSMNLAYEAEIEAEFPRLSAASLLKSTGFCISDNYESLPEKILSYMDLATHYLGTEIFIFVNLRSLINHLDMERFTETCTRHGYKIMLLDSHALDVLPNEKRIVIDMDLCEF